MQKEYTLIGIEQESLVSIIRQVVATELQKLISELKKKSEKKEIEVFTRKQACEFLQISNTTLWSLDKTQKLPSRKINSKVVYLKSDLVEFLNKKGI